MTRTTGGGAASVTLTVAVARSASPSAFVTWSSIEYECGTAPSCNVTDEASLLTTPFIRHSKRVIELPGDVLVEPLREIVACCPRGTTSDSDPPLEAVLDPELRTNAARGGSGECLVAESVLDDEHVATTPNAPIPITRVNQRAITSREKNPPRRVGSIESMIWW
jgi:hypothetical protein